MNDVMNPTREQQNGRMPFHEKVIAPRISSFVGVLSDLSDQIIPDEGNPYYLLTFTLPDGNIKTLPINCKFWDRIRNRYQLDCCVRVSMEHRIANKTSYTDRDTGEVIIHSKDGECFKTMNRIPDSLYTLEVKKGLSHDLEHRIVSQDEASKQQALATFYSNFYRS